MMSTAPIVLITAESNKSHEYRILLELSGSGLEKIHLRKPGISKAQMQDWLTKCPMELLGKIVLHTHHELVQQFPLKGIHLRSDEKNSYDSKKQYTSSGFHSINELERSNIPLGYAFLSPVFKSISKRSYGGISDFTKVKNISHPFPLIALGGVTENNATKAIEMGFDGVALLGAIWQRPEAALKTFKQIQQSVR